MTALSSGPTAPSLRNSSRIIARATSQARSGLRSSSPSGSSTSSSPIRVLKKYLAMGIHWGSRGKIGRLAALTTALFEPFIQQAWRLRYASNAFEPAQRHENADLLPVCAPPGVPSDRSPFAMQKRHALSHDVKISLANFLPRVTLWIRADTLSTSSQLTNEGEPKWPGKPPRSSKCPWAWKSTCMPAPPASRRTALASILTQVDLRT